MEKHITGFEDDHYKTSEVVVRGDRIVKKRGRKLGGKRHDIDKLADTVNQSEMIREREEMAAANAEMRKRRKNAKRRAERSKAMAEHIPASRVCPTCHRSKPRAQQWTLITFSGIPVAVCQGCGRRFRAICKPDQPEGT